MSTQQLNLEFTRGEQLSILREIRLGDPRKSNDRKPFAKLLLRALDDRIGRSKRWAMTVDELAEEAEMSRSATYQWLGWLNEAGLIGFDSLPDGRREFWICWSNLWQMTPAGRAAERAEQAAVSPPGGLASPPHGPAVHQVDQQSTTWTGGPPHGLLVHNVDCSYKEERPISAHSAPPSSSTPSGDRRREVTMMVKTAGVGLFGPAVETAIAHGMGLEQIAAVVGHFSRFPGRWPPEVLYERLTRVQAFELAPDEGWYGDTPQWIDKQRRADQKAADEAERALETERLNRIDAERKAVEELNLMVGDVFDGMSKQQRFELIPRGHPQESTLRSAIKFGVTDHVRGTFLRLLIEAMGGVTA